MARKRTHRVKKIEPAVQRLVFALPSDQVNGIHYIDLSQVASLVNRRFYRQGLNWAVGGFTVVSGGTAAPTAVVNISKLPNTWVMSNAWEKGMRSWMKMNRDALEESPSVRPRFLDFKVYADSQHAANGVSNNLKPWSLVSEYLPGEWEMSKFEIPTGSAGTQGASVSREVIATGNNYPGLGASGLDSISLIEGYAASRGLPQVLDPNTPDDAADVDGFNPDNWLAAVFNEGTTQTEGVIEDMISENNIAPYPFENDGVNLDTMYPGGALQGIGLEFYDQAIFTTTTIGAKQFLKGTNFPCGLIRLDIAGFSGLTNIFVDLIPGNHRGYLCEPMTEM